MGIRIKNEKKLYLKRHSHEIFYSYKTLKKVSKDIPT
jgi:hypothetical protein